MTETEWLAAERPSQVLRYLHNSAVVSDRKFRLFAVACCRRVAEHVSGILFTEVIDECERLAEELDPENWNPAHLNRLYSLRNKIDLGRSQGALSSTGAECDKDDEEFFSAVYQLTEFPIYPEHCADSCMSAICGHDDYVTGRGEMLFQVDICREIVGNPFRPITFEPCWRTSTVLAFATGIYEEKAFDRMPILADALQDAGCSKEDILNHCRQPGEHCRGCWVVDLILNKK